MLSKSPVGRLNIKMDRLPNAMKAMLPPNSPSTGMPNPVIGGQSVPPWIEDVGLEWLYKIVSP